MDLKEIENHWAGWARSFKSDLRATTKTPTIKRLEIYALYRALGRIGISDSSDVSVLEVGCGNGHNCLSLAELLPAASLTGVDFIPEMVDHAISIRDQSDLQTGVEFYQGNILELDANDALAPSYDVVFTDRCLINLNTFDLQVQGFGQLLDMVKPGGHVIIIENMQESYGWQNRLRTSVDLAPRTPDQFNLFIDEAQLVEKVSNRAELIDTENFGALHDLLLYVLVPMIGDGKVDYDHPIVQAATELLGANGDELSRAFGPFGQNRLLIFRKS